MTELLAMCCCATEPEFFVSVVKAIHCSLPAGSPPHCTAGPAHRWYFNNLALIPGWPRTVAITHCGQAWCSVGLDPPMYCYRMDPNSEVLEFHSLQEYVDWKESELGPNQDPGPMEVFPWPDSCDLCCGSTSPLYRRATGCPPCTPSDFNIYVPLDFPIFGEYFSTQQTEGDTGLCGHFTGQIVNQSQFISPLAVVAPTQYFDNCLECCDSLPPIPGGNCLNGCLGCADTYVVYIAYLIIHTWAMGNGCVGPVFVPPLFIEVERPGPGSCSYVGSTQIEVAAPGCAPGETITLSFSVQLTCSNLPPDGPSFQILLSMTPSCTRRFWGQPNKQCPPGPYLWVEDVEGLCDEFNISKPFIIVLP